MFNYVALYDYQEAFLPQRPSPTIGMLFFVRNYARAARMISKEGNKDYFKGKTTRIYNLIFNAFFRTWWW